MVTVEITPKLRRQTLPSRNSAAEMRTTFPSRATTIPVSVWIAILRARAAARFMAAIELRKTGSFAVEMSELLMAFAPIQQRQAQPLCYHSAPNSPQRSDNVAGSFEYRR